MKSIEIFLRKIILRFLLLLKKERIKNNPLLPNEKSKVLIIRLNRIGDALITTPLLQVLREKCDSEITVIADIKNSFIFEKCPAVNKILIFKKGFKEFFELVKIINQQKYDYVFDLHDDVSTTVSFLLAMINAENIIGLEKNTNLLYTHLVKKKDPSKTHVVDRIMNILEETGIEYDKEKINIYYKVSKNASKKATRLLNSYFPSSKFLLGINISAGSSARFWGVENFIHLLDSLDSNKFNILLLSSPSDAELLAKINRNKFKSYFTPDFEEFAAVIGNLDLFFTPDTSVVHIASAFRTPVFGLYVQYNTDDIIWYPYKSIYDAVITREPDFRNLSYKTVIEKFNPFLESIYNAKRNSKM